VSEPAALDLDALVQGFLGLTLAEKAWTHHAHLAVGAWHVHHYGEADALDRLRTGIRRLNESFGGQNTATSGYHETITAAYVRLLAQYLAQCPDALSLHESIARLLASPLAAKGALLAFYSQPHLMSVESRAAWAEPNIHPLDVATLLR
jgi:hypothetical protein